MKKLSLLGLAAIVLTATAMAGGIYLGSPVISGDFSSGQDARRTQLSPQQLHALSGWLEKHRSGWSGMVTPASTEPIQLQVNLRHSDGVATSLCVIAGAGGGHYLRLNAPGKWAYRSVGGIFKSGAATRPLTDEELSVLQKIVGAA